MPLIWFESGGRLAKLPNVLDLSARLIRFADAAIFGARPIFCEPVSRGVDHFEVEDTEDECEPGDKIREVEGSG